MALSPNYSWVEPDNSSLVKNGAQDIRALGDAIDTSLWNVGFGQAGKNKIINGDFGIWQRGTSFTLTGPTQTYGADRFQATGNATYSRQAFTAGTAPVAGYESQYFARWDITSNSANYDFGTRLEDVRIFAGQTVTFSFWAKASATTANAFFPRLQQNFGTGGSPSSAVYTDGSNISLTTSWARYSVTLSVPSISGKTIGTNGDSYFKPMVQLVTTSTVAIDFWGWQLEYGSKATPFETATGTIQGELAACQRYYYRVSSDAPGNPLSNTGGTVTTTIGQVYLLFPVTMRANTSAFDFSGIQWYNFANNTLYDTGTFTLSGGTKNLASVRYTHGSAIFTAGEVGSFTSGTSTSYIGFSAEL
jgi:hypothetical protein